MKNFAFPMNAEARDYWIQIAERMMSEFKINEDEAVGRINSVWGKHEYLSVMEVNMLLHETIEYWAKCTYYQPVPFWWKDESRAKPRAYPDANI
jgi:hypothetical protein